MKIVLASFMEPDNFGSGRIIGIASDRPKKIECDMAYPLLTPDASLIKEYEKLRDEGKQSEASTLFVTSFEKQHSDFKKNVLETARKNNKFITDILPFVDGDTLCSWEREQYTSYRPLVATCLEELGYDVELH